MFVFVFHIPNVTYIYNDKGYNVLNDIFKGMLNYIHIPWQVLQRRSHFEKSHIIKQSKGSCIFRKSPFILFSTNASLTSNKSKTSWERMFFFHSFNQRVHIAAIRSPLVIIYTNDIIKYSWDNQKDDVYLIITV